MDAFGVLHVMQGNTLILPDKQLFVDEACSGIVSLISILYCIAIYCVWRERGVVQAVLLLIAGVLWTIMMNSLRLTTIGLAWAWYKVDLAVGAPHSLLAVVLFGISILVIYALDRFLAEVLAPVDSEWRTQDREDAHPGLTLMQIWDRFFSTREDELAEEDDEATDEAEGLRVNRETLAQEQAASVARFSAPWSTFGIPVTTGFAALGLVYLSVFGVQETKYQGVVDRALDRALELSGTFVVDNQMGLEFKEFSSDRREIFRWDDWGQHSRTYSYADAEGAVYQVSCDFMFGPHWHDLRICYRGAGWKIRNESILRLGDLASSDREPLEVISSLTAPPLVEQFFIEREGEQQKGMITYGAFRASGEWFNRPRGAGLYNDMWAHIVQGRDRAEQADYFQVQVTTFFEGELSAEQKARAERLLKIAVERFKEGIGVEAKEEGNRG
jgi:exosortase/archaeosortase family protein